MDKEYNRWYRTFLGIKQRHTYWLYKVIDEVLNENPQIKGIVEIGTGAGALSVFLGLECYERSLKPLLTYDLKPFAKANKGMFIYKKPKLFDLLNIKYIARDYFLKESINEIKEYTDVPVLFFCDGGNKLEEFKFFTGIIKKDSIIAVHDWQSVARSALTYENSKGTVNKYNLIPLHEEEWDCEPDHIKTCFWRKNSE
jgi:hypothetical protein